MYHFIACVCWRVWLEAQHTERIILNCTRCSEVPSNRAISTGTNVALQFVRCEYAQVSLGRKCYADKAHMDYPRTEEDLGGLGGGGGGGGGGENKNKSGYYVFTVTSRTSPSNEQSAVRFDACKWAERQFPAFPSNSVGKDITLTAAQWIKTRGPRLMSKWNRNGKWHNILVEQNNDPM